MNQNKITEPNEFAITKDCERKPKIEEWEKRYKHRKLWSSVSVVHLHVTYTYQLFTMAMRQSEQYIEDEEEEEEAKRRAATKHQKHDNA